MDLQLRGRTVLITGAGSGIGAAVAAVLDGEGMRLILLDRDAEGLARTAALCRDSVTLVADVTQEEQIIAALARARRDDGVTALDALVCCAGISGPVGVGIQDVTRAEWDAVIAVNVTGPFLVLKHALSLLRASESASVVFVSSDSAVVSSAGMAPYCMSKGAIAQFARAMSVDLAGAGIRVNTVAPSVVDTPMSRADLGDAALDAPDFPVQSAAEVASHVAYLVSPRSRPVNGTALLSDFGYSARSSFPA